MTTKRRYSWTLRPELRSHPRPRTSEGWEGLDYATRLARTAGERRFAALDRDLMPEPLTLQRLAHEEGISATTVRARLKQAREEVFGRDLSDSTIDYRLRTRPSTHGARVCLEPTCDLPVPANASRARSYCDFHATAAARVRRHRGLPADRPTATHRPKRRT